MTAGAPATSGLPRRVFWVTFVGMLLAQLAWVLALPAFQGIDEFDHVFKAESVAHGQIAPPTAKTPHGRGMLVEARADVVDAASDVCASYPYTGHDNCYPVSGAGDGLVTIASAAASYNPVWYAVMGVVALPFSGDAADYAMRLITCLACAVMCAWAAALTTLWSRYRWPLVSFLLASTPVLVYSTSLATPNGIEYAGAMVTWAAALTLARPTVTQLAVTPLLLGSFAVCIAHSTGPMWLFFILLTTFLMAPVSHWTQLIREHRGAAVTTVLGVGAIAASSVLYVALAKTNAPENPGRLFDFDAPLVAIQNVLWPFQATAAFPMREQPAPPVVYALWMIPLISLLALATRRASRRTRVASLVLVVASVVIPTALTAATFSLLGTAWQGRYSLPLYVGLVLIAGWELGDRPTPRRAHIRVLMMMLAVAAGVSVAHVARDIVPTRVGVSAAELVPGGWLAVAVLAAIGTLLPVTLFHAPSRVPQSSQHETAELGSKEGRPSLVPVVS